MRGLARGTRGAIRLRSIHARVAPSTRTHPSSASSPSSTAGCGAPIDGDAEPPSVAREVGGCRPSRGPVLRRRGDRRPCSLAPSHWLAPLRLGAPPTSVGYKTGERSRSRRTAMGSPLRRPPDEWRATPALSPTRQGRSRDRVPHGNGPAIPSVASLMLYSQSEFLFTEANEPQGAVSGDYGSDASRRRRGGRSPGGGRRGEPSSDRRTRRRRGGHDLQLLRGSRCAHRGALREAARRARRGGRRDRLDHRRCALRGTAPRVRREPPRVLRPSTLLPPHLDRRGARPREAGGGP